MEQPDSSIILLYEFHRILSTAVDPVNIQFKSHISGMVPDNVQQIFTVILYELYMVVVIIQINFLLF